jgi:hypothetical protein
MEPKVAFDYSTNMEGLNLKDQMLQPYLLESKKGYKWYIRFFQKTAKCCRSQTNCNFLQQQLAIENWII